MASNDNLRESALVARDRGWPQEPRSAQTLSDLDQTSSDVDQTASDRDDTSAQADQSAAEEDQERADRVRRERARDPSYRADPEDEAAYARSQAARLASATERLGARVARTDSSRRRLSTSERRDATSRERDSAADVLDRELSEIERVGNLPSAVAAQLARVRERAAADRRRAAADRDRAAQERAEAAAEIARLHAELETAHLDDLTGAYRREMGNLTLQHEIERARRAEGSFVIAFVDVDGMKQVNDRDGHAAGDLVLKTLVWTMRAKLRPFDPIVRYGGDEFVAGLGGACIEEAQERFDSVCAEMCDEVGVGITVGLAELEPDETLAHLTNRADASLVEAKARRAAQGCASPNRP
jgi:diguanylate cyclase (GGDEF)-like protein